MRPVGCVSRTAPTRTRGQGSVQNSNVHRHASVLTPSIFMAQLPQIPSRQLRRKVKLGSTSFLIRIKASNIMGPVLFRSSVYFCMRGLEVGSSGFQRYISNVLILSSGFAVGSFSGDVSDPGTSGRLGEGACDGSIEATDAIERLQTGDTVGGQRMCLRDAGLRSGERGVPLIGLRRRADDLMVAMVVVSRTV